MDAAREQFATHGYDRATIRTIAAQAGIDPSMVMRYFGNKERLFAEAADFDLDLPDLGEGPRGQVGTRLVSHFLDRWEDDDESLRILLRTAATNEAIAERMRSIFAEQLTPAIARLDGDPTLATTRAALVSTQLLGMALARYVLHFPPITTMPPAEIVAWLGPTVQTYVLADPPRSS